MAVSRIVVLAVFVLDIIAFGLAIGAESRRNHASVVEQYSNSITYCRYSKDVATGLGIGAFLFLFFGQVLITGLTRCMCCSTPLRPSGARSLAIAFFILSWFTFVIAEVCLLGGATRAAYRRRASRNGDVLDCETLRRGIFSAAASFTLFTLLLSEGYYFCFVRCQEKNWQTYYPGPYNPGGGPYNPGGFGAAPYNPPYNPGGGPYNPGGFGAAPYNPPYNPGGPSIGLAAYPRH